MRRYRSLSRIFMFITAVLIFGASPAAAAAEGPYRLDEGAGLLTVIGSGRPPAAVQHPAQARLLAERAAITDAYGAAARLLSAAIPQAVSGQEGYSVFFRGGRVKRSDVAPDGSVRVELEIPVSPELAGRVREVMRERDVVGGQEVERAGISHEEFVARHRVRGPRVITLREWIDRYRAGAWVPYNQ
jgi:hypothetical protein